MKKRGCLLAIEGLDRAGKSTQVQLITKHIRDNFGVPCESIKFPCRETPVGKLIDQYLKNNVKISDESIHLLFSSNRWEKLEEIRQKLLSGVTVVLDRYFFSGIAYSNAKKLDFKWCAYSDFGMLFPDHTVFLDIPDIESLSCRDNFGDERYEKVEFLKRVRKSALRFHGSVEFINVGRANDTVKSVNRKVVDAFDSRFANSNYELKTLLKVFGESILNNWILE